MMVISEETAKILTDHGGILIKDIYGARCILYETEIYSIYTEQEKEIQSG
jgi:hypothetical protein